MGYRVVPGTHGVTFLATYTHPEPAQQPGQQRQRATQAVHHGGGIAAAFLLRQALAQEGGILALARCLCLHAGDFCLQRAHTLLPRCISPLCLLWVGTERLPQRCGLGTLFVRRGRQRRDLRGQPQCGGRRLGQQLFQRLHHQTRTRGGLRRHHRRLRLNLGLGLGLRFSRGWLHLLQCTRLRCLARHRLHLGPRRGKYLRRYGARCHGGTVGRSRCQTPNIHGITAPGRRVGQLGQKCVGARNTPHAACRDGGREHRLAGNGERLHAHGRGMPRDFGQRRDAHLGRTDRNITRHQLCRNAGRGQVHTRVGLHLEGQVNGRAQHHNAAAVAKRKRCSAQRNCIQPGPNDDVTFFHSGCIY